MALVATSTGVGVWAATSQQLTVNSTVNFTATGIAADIDVKMASSSITISNGKIGSSAATDPTFASYQELLSLEISGAGTAATSGLSFDMTPTTDNGFIAVGSTITYTFQIENTLTTGRSIGWSVTVGAASDTFKGYIGTVGTLTANDNGTLIAPLSKQEITVTFEVIAAVNDTTNIDTYDSTNGYWAMASTTQLPTVTINLKNATYKVSQ